MVDDGAVTYEIPRVPASAGALLTDGAGRLLVVKPTYKSGWTLPGGQIEDSGESPWEGCRREVAEETGLEVVAGRLAAVDFLRPRGTRPGGLRFLFDCGPVTDAQIATITLQEEELAEYRFADRDEAARLLRGPLARRVAAVRGRTATVYLEEGVPVDGVGP